MQNKLLFILDNGKYNKIIKSNLEFTFYQIFIMFLVFTINKNTVNKLK